jgi:S1-C subfamily serine protease
VLRIRPDGLTLHPLTLGDSSGAQVGDPVYAIGNPFDLERTLTTGVVSALQRQIQAPNGFTINNVLQTDAPINPGNSGGPLLDAAGRVIGINSQIETGGSGGGSVGIGFAVPINTAKSEIAQLEKGGTVRGAYLGLTSLTIDGSLSALNLPVKSGALVQTVQKGTAAAKAGIRAGTINSTTETGQIAVGGDIIVSMDGKAITSSEDLANAVSSKKSGQTVTIGLLRANGHGGYDHKTVPATLGSRPNSVPNANTPEG